MNEKKYEWEPENYTKNSSTQYQYAMEIIPKLNLTGHESVLDIGCGDGKISRQLKQLLPKGEVVGIDASEKMVDFARKTHQTSDREGISFYVMDASRIAFDRKFDVVFSSSALHWVKDQPAVLRGVKQCMKAGGRLFFQMSGQGSMEKMLLAFVSLLNDQKWKPYFSEIHFSGGFYTETQYREWLLEAGFTPLRVERVRKAIAFKEKKDLEGHIKAAWHPITERVPEAHRDAFVSDLVGRYLEIVPVNEDGLPWAEAVRLEVEAVRP